MSDTTQPKRFQCRHIYADGRRCGSPALRHEELCYYHHTSRKPAPHGRARRGRQTTFDLHLPDGNDRTGLQLAIVDVLRRIATNEVDPRRAGLLLYGLQIAAINLPQPRAELRAELRAATRSATPAETVEEIVLDESLGTLAPRYELIADDPGARNRSLTQELLTELRRGRSDSHEAAVCPSCKARQQPENPTPTDIISTLNNEVDTHAYEAESDASPSTTSEILVSLNASAAACRPLVSRSPGESATPDTLEPEKKSSSPATSGRASTLNLCSRSGPKRYAWKTLHNFREGERGMSNRTQPGLSQSAYHPFMALGLLLASITLHAQLPPGTADAGSSSSQPQTQLDPLRDQAAEALAHQDFPTALKLLSALAQKYPTDPHILFDLASVQDALDQTSPAEQTYRRAIASDPTDLASHLALGLLFARNSRTAEARAEFQTATTLTSPDPALKARAFRALAQIDRTSDPAAARDALLAALKLSPETPEDTLLSAELAEGAQDPAAAEVAYRRLLKRSPNDPAATAALAHLLVTENKSAEAEPLLTEALGTHPGDVALSAQLANLYIRGNKPEEATALVDKLHAANPGDPAITRLYARLLSQTGQYEKSEPLFANLSNQAPDDPTLLDDHADALIHLKRYAEAQQLLARAVAQPTAFPTKADLGSAASHLAFAATQNNDPNTTLRALEIRSTVLPQSPSSLFLTATANDKLHRYKQASDLYKQFLFVAKGQFPDEEWEARHRLIALEHMK